MHILVAGSLGLAGPEAAKFCDRLGFRVCGVNNNMHTDFFGIRGDKPTYNIEESLKENSTHV